MRKLLGALRKIGVGKVCWYAGLAALLVVLGLASYNWRNRASAWIDPGNTPRAAMAVHTPDPVSAWVTEIAPSPEPTSEPVRFVWPVEGDIIGKYAEDSMLYNADLGQWQTHPAIDIAAAVGEAVLACADGTVADAWEDRLWGNVIQITHRDGYVSTYANLSTLRLVSIGEDVTAGQTIAAVGRTAICEASLAGHLHFALEKSGKFVNFEIIMSNSPKI
ncbi:MAG: peptidoglycan DD-metalloendopeptidase family protein [bacterium]